MDGPVFFKNKNHEETLNLEVRGARLPSSSDLVGKLSPGKAHGLRQLTLPSKINGRVLALEPGLGV
jgi:hypothetical protein